MFKNTASQQWVVFAFQDEGGSNPGEPVTADQANITANVRIDAGGANAVDDTNPTVLEDGYYSFGITAAESNGDSIVITPVSSTGNVNVIGVPGAVYTRAAFGPTVTEFNARTLVAASYFDPTADAVSNVTLVATTTASTDAETAIAALNDAPAVTAATIANLVWDTDATARQTQGTFGQAIGDPGADATTIYQAVATDAAGDNVAIDIIAVKGNTADILVDTADIQPNYATEAKQDIIDKNVDDLELGIIFGLVETGTLTVGSCTTGLTGFTDDQLIGRVIIFTSGPADGEATDITDYANTNGLISFTDLTLAPENGNAFKVV